MFPNLFNEKKVWQDMEISEIVGDAFTINNTMEEMKVKPSKYDLIVSLIDYLDIAGHKASNNNHPIVAEAMKVVEN